MKLKQSIQDYFLGNKTLLRAFIIWCLGYILTIISISLLFALLNYITSGASDVFIYQHKIALFIIQEMTTIIYTFIIVPLSIIVISQCWRNTKHQIVGRIISIIYYLYAFMIIIFLSNSIKFTRANSELFFTEDMPLNYSPKLYWYLFIISIIVSLWVTHKTKQKSS